MAFHLSDFLAIVPEIFIIFSLSYLLLFGSFFADSPFLIFNSFFFITLQSVFFAFLLSCYSVCLEGTIFFGSLVIDNLVYNSKVLLALFSGCCLVCMRVYLMNRGIVAFEYLLLLLFSFLSMFFLCSSFNFLTFYLCLEFQSLAFYVLAAFKRGSAFSTEAGLKYFILGAFASGLILFGFSLVYFSVGTLDFEKLIILSVYILEPDLFMYGGLVFFFGGVFFKLAVAPFHCWVADVYEGSPSSTTLIFALLSKLPFLVFLLRIFFFIFFSFFSYFQAFFVAFGLLSILVGICGAFFQRKFKKFLAYSSISHVGFILLAFTSGDFLGIQAVFFYIFSYMTMSLLIWMILLYSDSAQKKSFKYLDEISFIKEENPFLALLISLVVFSMAGVPPFIGFYSKYFVFKSLLISYLFVPAILGVVLSVLGSFYYLRFVKILLFSTSFFEGFFICLDKTGSYLFSINIIFILFFCLNPSPFLLWTHLISLSIIAYIAQR